MLKIIGWILIALVVTVVVYLTWHLLVAVRAERAAHWVSAQFDNFTQAKEEALAEEPAEA